MPKRACKYCGSTSSRASSSELCVPCNRTKQFIESDPKRVMLVIERLGYSITPPEKKVDLTTQGPQSSTKIPGHLQAPPEGVDSDVTDPDIEEVINDSLDS